MVLRARDRLRRQGLVAGIVIAGVLFAGGLAFAASETITATDSGGANSFSQATYTMDQGERPTFTDGGANQHNVTSSQNGPDGRLLFSTPTINGGQQATLSGTQYLSSGSYQFFCSIHPTEMRATLVVGPGGAPQARPSASLSVRSKKVAKVSKKGILVALTTSTKVDDVSLTAKLGKAVIGRANGLSLAAGPQFEVLKLSKAGKNKLKGKSKASVSVTADIPFGPPASAKAKLT